MSIACGLFDIICRTEGRNMRRLVAIVALLVTGCVETGQMIPLDETAKAIGTPQIEIAIKPYGPYGYGPIAVTMPDGEILRGDYQVLASAAIALASSGQYVATGLPVGSRRVAATATGIRTVMTCDGITDDHGHGSALCGTNSGAHYRVLF
jgi:hypothetical protein